MRIWPISSHNGFVDPPANLSLDCANNTTRGGTIQTIGIPRAWSLVLASAVAALAGMVVFAMLHEMRSRPGQQVAPATSQRPEPRALTAEEERYAAALWEVHREVTPSAVAMSFAGIAYKTEMQDAHELARRIAPLAKFFTQAEARVGSLAVPASLSKVHGQYAEAMTLYANASDEMLKFVQDGQDQRLLDAQRMGLKASDNMLRVGEALWPGQYKPH